MAELYYASFSPVMKGRLDVVEGILETLHLLDAKIDVDLYELKLTGNTYDYTFEEIESLSLYNGLEKTNGWDGVEFHFTLFERGCSFLLLADILEHTTAVFSEPKPLFESQLRSPDRAADLVIFLSETMGLIGADFCIFEPGWTGRSRTHADVEEWIADCAAGRDRDWEFVLLSEAVWPRNRIASRIGYAYRAAILSPELWIATKIGRLQFPDPSGSPKG